MCRGYYNLADEDALAKARRFFPATYQPVCAPAWQYEENTHVGLVLLGFTQDIPGRIEFTTILCCKKIWGIVSLKSEREA